MKSEESRNEYYPDTVSPPGATLQETISAYTMTQTELADRIGLTKKTINGIVSGKEPITPTTALHLEHVLGIPARFWINREQRYREFLARREEQVRLEQDLEWLKKFPVADMVKFGWIKRYNDRVQLLREILDFFGVATPGQLKKIVIDPLANYRKSMAFKTNPIAMAAWLRCGELKGKRLHCKPYDVQEFRRALANVRTLTKELPSVFLKEVVQICAEAGVAIVFIPELPGTHVYGATRWINSKKALLQLSLRRKTDDHLWFTFFHEAYHILNPKKTQIIIETNDMKDEDAANRFAANHLIPKSQLSSFLETTQITTTSITDFASRIGISAGIVVGRLQHEEKVPQSHYNKLKLKFKWKIRDNTEDDG